MKKISIDYCLIIFLFFFSIILGMLLVKSPLIAEADAYSRANTAIYLKEQNNYFNTQVKLWLPLHFTILSSSLVLFNDNIDGMRLITILISSLSIISIYFYSYNLIRSSRIAIFSAFIYALLPLRIIISTQTLSEAIFIFFLISALALLSMRNTNILFLMCSIILLNFAHGIRYESWLLIPLIWVIILHISTSRRIKTSLLFSSLIFPIYWIILDKNTNGSSFNFFIEKYSIAQNQYQREYYNLILSLKAWLDNLINIVPIIFFPAYFIGSINSYKQKKFAAIYSFIPIYLFLTLIFQTYIGSMEWFPVRYLFSLIILAIPFITNGLVLAIQILIELSRKNNYFSAIITLFLTLTIFVSPIFYYHHYIKIKKILIDSPFLEDYSQNVDIYQSERYYDFFSVVDYCKEHSIRSYIYLYNDNSRTYLDEAMFYYLSGENKITAPKESFTELISEYPDIVVIIEKQQLNDFKHDLFVLHENKSFVILKKIKSNLKLDSYIISSS